MTACEAINLRPYSQTPVLALTGFARTVHQRLNFGHWPHFCDRRLPPCRRMQVLQRYAATLHAAYGPFFDFFASFAASAISWAVQNFLTYFSVGWCATSSSHRWMSSKQ